jgi:Holliday junction DNA helicase RuvA
MGLGIAEPLARRAVDQADARLGPEVALPALIKAALQEVGR